MCFSIVGVEENRDVYTGSVIKIKNAVESRGIVSLLLLYVL